MSNNLQDVDFSHDSSDVRLVLDHVFFENFDGHLLLSQLVDTLAYFSKRSLSDRLADHVVADEATICSFLSALSCLPVTFFSFLLLKFGQSLAK